ncbi:hypothetical protein EON81_07700 [bacterium]|nr:MAG: hypothetical protein EON81_07700 [bacterium]
MPTIFRPPALRAPLAASIGLTLLLPCGAAALETKTQTIECISIAAPMEEGVNGCYVVADVETRPRCPVTQWRNIVVQVVPWVAAIGGLALSAVALDRRDRR